MALPDDFQPRTLSDLVSDQRLDGGGLDRSAAALTDGTVALNWFEYVNRVGRLRATLIGAGVQVGDRVGVRLAKSVESFIAVHAVLGAGAVMVPIDPATPLAYAAALIADAGVEVVITDDASSIGEQPASFPTIRCVILPKPDARVPDRRHGISVIVATDVASIEPVPAVEVDADDAAYIIYTSGSTGQPKGIVHSHASALAYAATAAGFYELRSDDRLVNIAPLHFDQSTFELYAAPLVGAAVLIVPEPVIRFPASLSDLIVRERITVWYSVPYLLGQLSTRGVLDERDLSALRWVLFGGESFPPGQLAALMHQLPGAQFSNVYGPAEVNQCMAYNVPAAPDDDQPVPIGRAWPGAELRVVDPDDLSIEVPSGAAGVLLVRTPTMMSRYWNRADLTAAAVVEDRNAQGDPERWYVTGDLVAEQDDGIFTFLGRVDNQIKLHGHRIELEAIDAVLRDIEGVLEATVVVLRPDAGDDRLVALVVLSATPGVDHCADDSSRCREISATLQRRLPKYAVPGEVIAVGSLPRTGTGKIDRNASEALLDSSDRRR